ncbi:DUF3310 domain-containing protein [Caldibacillus thermolactis]|jgi:hypothetical protein|uniref:DUF3310 domain-containing protein n=1 Tax=Pallidibacillus thermolactis TaxID=251051 RepID=A0ABT2WGR0_9BACI|nr:DUF3310 domain-containing protein [Pallidibacillus thermolactis]MCU9594612.1 DUF3310 domain-containing protein [Pallidibacillus thermolactis]
MIEKPSYYHKGKIDVIAFAKDHYPKEQIAGFFRMNILKYVDRYQDKNGLEDLKKARNYLDMLIELEGEGNA